MCYEGRKNSFFLPLTRLFYSLKTSTLIVKARFMDLPVWPLRSWSNKCTQNEIQSLNIRIEIKNNSAYQLLSRTNEFFKCHDNAIVKHSYTISTALKLHVVFWCLFNDILSNCKFMGWYIVFVCRTLYHCIIRVLKKCQKCVVIIILVSLNDMSSTHFYKVQIKR